MKIHLLSISNFCFFLCMQGVISSAQNAAYTFPVQNNTYLNALAEGPDHSIVLAGNIDFGNANRQGLLGKFSSDGTWEWGFQMQSPNLIVDFLRILKLPDGDFLAGGNDGNTIILVKFSDQGNVVWQRSISAGTLSLKMVDFVLQDQQIWMVGNFDDTHGILFAIKPDGDLVPNRALQFHKYDYTYPTRIRMSGNNLVITGSVHSSDSSILSEGFITLLNTDLSMVKSWSLGGDGNQQVTSLATDGTDIIIGLENQQPTSTGIIKMDGNGNITWSHALDGLYLRGIYSTSNHDLLFTGGVGDLNKLTSAGSWLGGINFFSSGSIPIRSFDAESGINLLSGAPNSQPTPYNIYLFRLDSDLQPFCNSWNFTYQIDELNMPLQELTWITSKDISLNVETIDRPMTNAEFEVSVLCQETSGTRSLLPERFQIHPNPFSEQFSIRIPEDWPACKLSIWTVDGKLLANLRAPVSGQLMWNLPDLPSGVYFLKCSNQLGTITRKILKVSGD